MEKIRSTAHILALILVLASSHYTTESRREVEDEGDFSYRVESRKGPEHWGDLRHEWSMCNKGTMQSPIDLSKEKLEMVSHLGNLQTKYAPSHATLVNEGHAMKMSWEGGAGSIEINGQEYELSQMHWHSPSEHAINGQKFDLEAHLVHISKNDNIAVVAVIYKLGNPDPFLSEFEKDLRGLQEIIHERRTVGMVDPTRVKIGSDKYYRYQGSLTAPPCSENVIWTVVDDILTVSKTQLEWFVNAIHDDSKSNARPLQPINSRPVEFCKPEVYYTQKG